MTGKIRNTISESELQQDLQKYRTRAIALGATDAKIITTDMVMIDERVQAKCIYPKCPHFGTSANCPPYSMGPEQTRILVDRFRYAIFYRVKVPTELLAGKRTPEALETQAQFSKTRNQITATLESEAFYDGYYLAVGFSGGSCKGYFCSEKDCSALEPGKGCRFPLLARSSMEAVGMDVYFMATAVGWDIYPLGRASSDAPHGTLAGIVFIY
ncbi:DUF2284 domain-containing protein [Chloroflexota bacterium]